jgi:hypothetical protein
MNVIGRTHVHGHTYAMPALHCFTQCTTVLLRTKYNALLVCHRNHCQQHAACAQLLDESWVGACLMVTRILFSGDAEQTMSPGAANPQHQLTVFLAQASEA